MYVIVIDWLTIVIMAYNHATSQQLIYLLQK